jgi:hypothetical protein
MILLRSTNALASIGVGTTPKFHDSGWRYTLIAATNKGTCWILEMALHVLASWPGRSFETLVISSRAAGCVQQCCLRHGCKLACSSGEEMGVAVRTDFCVMLRVGFAEKDTVHVESLGYVTPYFVI